MDLVAFWTICSINGITLDKEQMALFDRYAAELLYWNEKVNLISRKDEENVVEKHLLHSVSALKYLDIKKKARIIDIGTGGGLPGIPIKIARPDVFMILTDSIAKKAKIAKMLAAHTGLRNIDAIRTRAEELAKDKIYRNSFDWAFSRATARLSKLMAWSKGLLKKDGKLAAYKGGDLSEEIEEAKKLFPFAEIKTIDLNIKGADSFIKDEKKVVVCSNFAV